MVEALRRGSGAGGETPADPGVEGAGAEGSEEGPLFDIDSLDWQLISQAAAERGPAVGMYLMAKALTEALNGGIRDRMTKALEPFGQLRQHTMASVETARLWNSAQEAVGEDGSLIFPELSDPDPNVAQTVFDLWRQITDGMPAEVANSPRMVRSAILEYRLMSQAGAGGDAGNGAAGGVNPASVAAGAVGALRAGARSAGVLPTGRAPAQVQRQRRSPETEEEKIRRSLLTEGQERSALGFRR